MNPVLWLQMTNMISYQGLVRTFPKEDLQQKAGKPVETVPQIFVDQQHIGGYTDFAAWVKENLDA